MTSSRSGHLAPCWASLHVARASLGTGVPTGLGKLTAPGATFGRTQVSPPSDVRTSSPYLALWSHWFPCLWDFSLLLSLTVCVPRDPAPTRATLCLVGNSIYSHIRVFANDHLSLYVQACASENAHFQLFSRREGKWESWQTAPDLLKKRSLLRDYQGQQATSIAQPKSSQCCSCPGDRQQNCLSRLLAKCILLPCSLGCHYKHQNNLGEAFHFPLRCLYHKLFVKCTAQTVHHCGTYSKNKWNCKI